MEAPKVKIGAHEESLVKPSSLAALDLSRTPVEIEAMSRGEILALGVAALIESWPKDRAWPIQPRPRPWKPGQRIMESGREAFDRLAESGIDLVQIMDAGIAALGWASQSLLAREELEAVRDFSAAPEGGMSEKASGSAGNTASPSTGG